MSDTWFISSRTPYAGPCIPIGIDLYFTCTRNPWFMLCTNHADYSSTGQTGPGRVLGRPAPRKTLAAVVVFFQADNISQVTIPCAQSALACARGRSPCGEHYVRRVNHPDGWNRSRCVITRPTPSRGRASPYSTRPNTTHEDPHLTSVGVDSTSS